MLTAQLTKAFNDGCQLLLYYPPDVVDGLVQTMKVMRSPLPLLPILIPVRCRKCSVHNKVMRSNDLIPRWAEPGVHSFSELGFNLVYLLINSFIQLF